MNLSVFLVLALLFAALLHAGWNALIKSGGDKSLDTALIHSLGLCFALPAVLWFGLPPVAAWPFIAASCLIHIAYYAALAGAYRYGDLGLTYPIMRGSAPLLVALVSVLLMDEQLSGAAWLGVIVLSAGVLLVGLARAGQDTPGHRRKALGFALANACIIACYTVIDGMGVRAAGNAFSYVAALFLFDRPAVHGAGAVACGPATRRGPALHARARAAGTCGYRGFSGQLRHCTVGHAARAGGAGRRAARNLGDLCRPDRHLDTGRTLRLGARRRHRPGRCGRGDAALQLTP
jgi:drug/metabolite transporter (DMT)-like permease